MKNRITFVGLDVHKNSIDVAIADSERDGEVRNYGKIGGDLDSLHKVVRKLEPHCASSMRPVLAGMKFIVL